MKRTRLKRKTPLKGQNGPSRLRSGLSRGKGLRKRKLDVKAEERRLGDARFQTDVVMAARGRCAVCGKHKPDVAGHHLIHRGYQQYRHHIPNGLAVCYKHHMWIHGNNEEFEQWFKENLPDRWEWFVENRRRAKQGLGPKEEENNDNDK